MLASYLAEDVVEGLLQLVVRAGQLPEVAVRFQDGDDQLVDLIHRLIQASLGKARGKWRGD